MTLKEFLKNKSFIIESPCIVRLIDRKDNTLDLWNTWENEIPEDIYNSNIVWFTTFATEEFPGCDSAIIIDVLKED